MNSKKIIFIVGPTAVGKSQAAVCLAKNIQGEIISCDSMQIYKEINIASDKPSRDILNKVPHHLVNVLSVEEEFDVARYNQLALAAIRDIHGRDHIPVVVGGSGMYMQILLDGIFEGGGRNTALRKDLKEQACQYGNQFLYDKLKEEDSQAAKKIHPNDVRRVIRALEICVTEKMPISQLQKQREGLWGKYDIMVFALNREREELYRKIGVRVEEMVQEGLIEEIERLSKVKWSLTANKIIGIREVQGFLKREYSLDQAKELIKLNTRHLAKRQLTWFRRDKRLKWIVVEPDDTAERIAEIMMRQWKARE